MLWVGREEGKVSNSHIRAEGGQGLPGSSPHLPSSLNQRHWASAGKATAPSPAEQGTPTPGHRPEALGAGHSPPPSLGLSVQLQWEHEEEGHQGMGDPNSEPHPHGLAALEGYPVPTQGWTDHTAEQGRHGMRYLGLQWRV